MTASRRLLVVPFIAALALIGATPAAAVVSWTSAPQTVSVAERDNERPAVAMDAAGNGVAVWKSSSGTTKRVEAAFRAPGQNFTAPATVRQSTGNYVYPPVVAMNRSGTAVAAWYEYVGSAFTLHVAVRAAGASGFGAEQDLGPSVSYPQQPSPAVAVDASGNVLVVGQGPGASGGIVTATKPVGGSFGPLTKIQGSDGGLGPAVAFDPQGGALVAFSRDPNTSDLLGSYIQVSSRAAGGSFSSPTSISSPTDLGSGYPAIQFDAAGNAVVAWTYAQDDYNEHVEWAYRPRGNTFGPPATIPGSECGSTAAEGPKLGLAPAGATVVVFDCPPAGSQTGQHLPKTAVRLAGGSFGTATVFDSSSTSDSTGTYPLSPDVGIDDGGEGASLWLSHPTRSTQRILAATRSGLTGAFNPAQELSPTGVEDVPPALAVSPNGQAIAAWTRTNGQNLQVQVKFGTPSSSGSQPQQAPPPPPPPPQPPVPSAIQAARPLNGAAATVLTARVTGQVTALRWSFGTNAPAITSYAGDPGGLKASVRLRPRNRRLDVKLTASGPGGSTAYQRSFTLPAAPDDRTSDVVRGSIDRQGSRQVVAVGDASTLTGSGGCGELKIRSASQTMTGCFRPVDEIGDIPTSGRGVLNPVAAALGVDLGDGNAVAKAVSLSDGYAGYGRAVINGTWPVVTHGGAALMYFPQEATLASANARFVVAGREMGPAGTGLNFPLDPESTTITLGDIPIPSGLRSLGGFPLGYYFYVVLRSGQASIDTVVQLPSSVSKFGQPVYTRIRLSGDGDRLLPTRVAFDPQNVDFGALPVRDFSLGLRWNEGDWLGGGSACALGIACFDLKAPDGNIYFKDGKLAFAGLRHDFGSPGKPIAPGAFLEYLSAGFGLDPSRLIGAARIGTGGIVKVDGKAVLAFPSGRTPYVLQRSEAGNNFPAEFYSRRFTNPTAAASADLKLALPIGEVRLGGGYVAYEAPNYAAFGGGFNQNIADVLTLNGGVSGEFDVVKPVYNLHGTLRACVADIVCGGSVTHLSQDGQGNGGVGSCVQYGPFSVGGGKLWKDPVPKLWPLDGCKWSPFRLAVGSAAAAQAGSFRVTVKRGQPSQVIQLNGYRGAPMVRVTGPGGQSLDSTGAKLKVGPGGHIRIVRFENPRATFTSIGLQNATPGVYTVTTLPGSAPVLRELRASDPADAKVRGTVSGSGPRKVFAYEVRRRPAQSVRFYESTGAGAAKLIGTVRGGKGTLRFTSTPGFGARRIEARFSLNGLPAEIRTVTRFKPVSPILARVRGLRVARSRKGVVAARWGRVPGASTYQVVISLSNGRQLYRTTRRPALTLRGLSRSLSGRVGVRAAAPMRTGGTASTGRFKRLVRPASRFRTYRRCKVTKKKVTGCGVTKKPTKRKATKRR